MKGYILSAIAGTSMLAMVARSSEDPLADLGLDLGGTETASADAQGEPVTETVTEAVTDGVVKEKRKEVEIADLDFGFADFIPKMERGGKGGSKYEFEKLQAPVAKEDGSGFKYAMFVAKLANPEDDVDALKRSVQSANTAENKQHKDAGTPNRYITRQHIVGGEFIGIAVYRVDGTLDVENDKG